jgi:hypothetical protein
MPVLARTRYRIAACSHPGQSAQAAHNDDRADRQSEHVTGDLCVERHERICVDLGRRRHLSGDVRCARSVRGVERGSTARRGSRH